MKNTNGFFIFPKINFVVEQDGFFGILVEVNDALAPICLSLASHQRKMGLSTLRRIPFMHVEARATCQAEQQWIKAFYWTCTRETQRDSCLAMYKHNDPRYLADIDH